MIEPVKAVFNRRSRSGKGVLLRPGRTPFLLSAAECRALAKLIRLQRDAFDEAETGLRRRRPRGPFTPDDLILLEPLFDYLRGVIKLLR